MSWLWLWTDILDSEKIAELDDATIGGWILILAATKRFDENGLVPPIKKLSHWCRRPEMTVRAWVSKLLEVGLLEIQDSKTAVHDWLDWQPRSPGPRPSGKAMSNTVRQRAWRERRKAERNGVTPPLHSPREYKRGEESIVRTPLRNEIRNVRNSVTPPPPPLSSLPWDDRQQQCIDQATRHWGASNGDVIVGELLRTFSPEIVMASMDVHFERFKQELKPAYLRKTCEGKYRDQENGRTP